MFGLLFAPETWLKVRLFRQFIGPPFPDHPELSKGVTAIENHLSKYEHIARLTNRMLGTLTEDHEELAAMGFSHAHRHHEFAALNEALFCELYASLDGLRRSIFGAYSRIDGVQNKSTKQLFSRAFERSYGPRFPEVIRTVLAQAYETWFPELRQIRTEVTHGDVGYCHLEKATGTVTYVHPAIHLKDGDLVISNLGKKLDELSAKVVELTEHVFGFWYSQLEQRERLAFCGIWKGRFYQRRVVPEPQIGMASGVCQSAWWFRNDPAFSCPLATQCQAYTRRQTLVREKAYSVWEERGVPLWDDQSDWYDAEGILSRIYLEEQM